MPGHPWSVSLGMAMPRDIRFGAGLRWSLPDACDDLGMERPFVVIDPAVADDPGLRPMLERAATSFMGFDGETREPAVLAGTSRYRESGCDGIVAVGGGSVLDGAKLVGLLATHPGPLARYSATDGLAVPATPALVPCIAVPTTAGSGSEVGRAALVITDAGHKVVIRGDALVPSVALLDPEITVTLPARLTAGTAMDALSHCVEELLASPDHPVIDTLAAEGIRRIDGSLLAAVGDPSHLDARSTLLVASLLGGLGLQKGLGAVHALSHPLAAVRAHHGTANAVLMPYLLRRDKVRAHARFGRIRDAFGGVEPAQRIEQLRDAAGLPGRLSELGLHAADIPTMAARALRDPAMASDPAPLTLDDAMAIYAAAL